jgi:hypothetical protein
MKNFYILVLVIVFIIVSHVTKAQQPINVHSGKPALFAAVLNNLDCPVTTLETLFTKTPGQQISFSSGSSFVFTGTVRSNVVKSPQLTTMIIASTNYSGAVLSVSYVNDGINPPKYVGRILSMAHSDVLELNPNGSNYQWVKKPIDEVIPSCHQ